MSPFSDVVTAYKGLLKEKEALESSLAAVNKASPSREVKPNENGSDTDTKKQEEDTASVNGNYEYQEQLATLMNSLATLSAEKSRQEASFQNDKRQLRQEIAIKDKVILDLQERVKQAGHRSSSDVETLKSKLIVEKHERDSETRDHMARVREMQKLLTDERHLKESLEMQLNDLKGRFGETQGDGSSDKGLKELRQELDEARTALKEYEGAHRTVLSEDSTAMFQQLQDEMSLLKQQHAVAIQSEQKRALLAEDTNRKLATHHEERVASLEARLSELSCSYVRHRQQDQLSIAKLKDKLARLNVSKVEEQQPCDAKGTDVHQLLEQITQLKKRLLIENARTENPIDLSKIFVPSNGPPAIQQDIDESVPLSEYNKVKSEVVALVEENDTIKFSLDEQKVHIRTLQEKVKVLNRNIEEHETELSKKQIEFNQILMHEKKKWKDTFTTLESEYRSKVSQLENELQKQRERSVSLLEEKEKEIKTLKTSFEIFIPGNPQMMNTVQQESQDPNSDSESPAAQLSNILNSSKFQQQRANGPNADSFHMLHYAHELARKDVEITNLRKAKHTAETSLRQALHDKVTSQQELHDKISTLEEEVDRLTRYHSREGANLEYLKNVIVSYLVSRDSDSRKHMLNAIGAVLKFSPSEMNTISQFLTTGKK